MKKKIIIGLLISALLLTGTAFANGTFEGYSIVNIFVDGKKVEGDVPAINFNGRTMVPVRFVSEALGAEVQWDGNTGTATITSKSNDKAIEDLKFYSKVAEQYRRLESLGNLIQDTGNDLSLALQEHVTKKQYTMINSLEQEFYPQLVDAYNLVLEESKNTYNEAEKRGIYLYDLKTIVDDYYTAINAYKTSMDSLKAYFDSELESDFNAYSDNSGIGFDSSLKGMQVSKARYFEYYNIIQNY